MTPERMAEISAMNPEDITPEIMEEIMEQHKKRTKDFLKMIDDGTRADGTFVVNAEALKEIILETQAMSMDLLKIELGRADDRHLVD